MKRRFNGKKVVIVGAGGGLGESYTRAFLKEGAALLLAGRNQQRLQELASSLSEIVTIAQVDITNEESVEAMALLAAAWAGKEKIDIVVNATGFDVRKAFMEHQMDDIHKSLNTNLLGSILLSKAFLPYMREDSGSTIVHMGGFTDGRMAFPYYSVDVATRSGIFSFVESMNRELQQEGSKIRLTYFCPNSADTDAERPFHPVWKEMGIKISSTEQVAVELLKTIHSKKTVYLMGGVLTRFFAKINALFPKLADTLLLKNYGKILKKHFHTTAVTKAVAPQQENEKEGGILRKIAIGLVVLSFVLYGLLPVVPFLPVGISTKAVITGGMLVTSEIVFWVGGVILGKEIVSKFRKVLNPCNWFSSCKASDKLQ